MVVAHIAIVLTGLVDKSGHRQIGIGLQSINRLVVGYSGSKVRHCSRMGMNLVCGCGGSQVQLLGLPLLNEQYWRPRICLWLAGLLGLEMHIIIWGKEESQNTIQLQEQLFLCEASSK